MRWLIAMLVLCSLPAAADTYRWVDENGVVNYSDTWHPGAEKVELGQVETTHFARPAAPQTSAGGSQAAGGAYESVAILRPQPEETLWNLEGRLDVQVAVQPSIQSGDRLALYLDGTAVAGVPVGATSFTIDKVYRGMHTLRATVVGSDGRVLGGSDMVRFYVQQTSVANPPAGPSPNPPPRPTPRPRSGG